MFVVVYFFLILVTKGHGRPRISFKEDDRLEIYFQHGKLQHANMYRAYKSHYIFSNVIVAVKVFRTITHNMHIIARAMLNRVYTLMECPSAWCQNKTRPKNFCRDNSSIIVHSLTTTWLERLTHIFADTPRQLFSPLK